jgi:NAD(P)-dependent dehydrogenase (short-subunit alcohol dehydrogenase family)
MAESLLDRRVAVVIGCHGLGRETARSLTGHGGRAVLSDLRAGTVVEANKRLHI